MTPLQQTNVLNWVEALLSGNYVHGKNRLYNPETNVYSAEGVALEIAGIEKDDAGTFLFGADGVKLGRHITIVPSRWFAEEFGLPHPAQLYSTMNDRSRDYLAVIALLLEAVPKTHRRRAFLHTKFMEAAGAHKNTVR